MDDNSLLENDSVLFVCLVLALLLMIVEILRLSAVIINLLDTCVPIAIDRLRLHFSLVTLIKTGGGLCGAAYHRLSKGTCTIY